jgi:hypothetical protein
MNAENSNPIVFAQVVADDRINRVSVPIWLGEDIDRTSDITVAAVVLDHSLNCPVVYVNGAVVPRAGIQAGFRYLVVPYRRVF